MTETPKRAEECPHCVENPLTEIKWHIVDSFPLFIGSFLSIISVVLLGSLAWFGSDAHGILLYGSMVLIFMLISVAAFTIWAVKRWRSREPLFVFQSIDPESGHEYVHFELASPVNDPVCSPRELRFIPSGPIFRFFGREGDKSIYAADAWWSSAALDPRKVRVTIRDAGGYTVGGLQIHEALALVTGFDGFARSIEGSFPFQDLAKRVPKTHRACSFVGAFIEERNSLDALERGRQEDQDRHAALHAKHRELDRTHARQTCILESLISEIVELTVYIKAAKPPKKGAPRTPLSKDVSVYNQMGAVLSFLEGSALANVRTEFPAAGQLIERVERETNESVARRVA